MSVLFLNSWRASSHIVRYDTNPSAIDTQEKLRLNFHSISVSVSELSEYGRQTHYLNSFALGSTHEKFKIEPGLKNEAMICFVIIYHADILLGMFIAVMQ